VKPGERFSTVTRLLEARHRQAGHQELRTMLSVHSPLREQATDLYQAHRLLGFARAATAADSESFISTLAQVPVSGPAFVEDSCGKYAGSNSF